MRTGMFTVTHNVKNIFVQVCIALIKGV